LRPFPCRIVTSRLSRLRSSSRRWISSLRRIPVLYTPRRHEALIQRQSESQCDRSTGAVAFFHALKIRSAAAIRNPTHRRPTRRIASRVRRCDQKSARSTHSLTDWPRERLSRIHNNSAAPPSAVPKIPTVTIRPKMRHQKGR
jgi:hypothetical protein